MTEQELLKDVKNKLTMYNPYTNKITQYLLEIEAIEDRMKATQGSFVKIPDGTVTPNIHKNSPLWEEIYLLEEEINKFSPTIDQVNCFIDKLDREEKEIIKSLFMRESPMTQQQLAMEKDYTREGMRDKANRIIVKHWEY